jgi:hypothetical protein
VALYNRKQEENELERKELKKFFRKCSEIKGFDNWMIGKLVFSRQEESTELTCEVKKRKEKAAVLEVAGNGIIMEMYLLKPERTQKKAQAWEGKETCVEIISKVFSKEEILAFVMDAGDENPIHQTQNPVVPGLFLAEWLWLEGNVSLEGKKMIFQAPLYAQEKVTVYLEKKTQVYFGVSDGRILWKACYLK